ncbi:MAG: hypothetical protein JWN46_2687 [Acidimicrobiales bacterium]|nr:hypothetical protein [Acidimicrobiales bacterium]
MRTTPRRASAHLLVAAAMLVTAGAYVVASPQLAAAATTPGDGTAQGSAGASCWGIKQQAPASASGLYWLLTSKLEAPQQFYCDMTTDGGGWVLVARGREGWTFGSTGQGSPQIVRSTTTGTGAFTPAALSSPLIDKVLDGQSVAALPDGIRVRRATNTNGSSWQELRLKVATQQQWSWAFGGGIILSSTRVDGNTYQGGNTRDTSILWGGQSTNQLAGQGGTLRLWTYPWANHGWAAGFAYGSGVQGSSNSSSYLWQSSNEGYPIGFAQVWLRPQIANSALPSTPVPDAGFAPKTVPAELKTHAEPNPWGVSGIDKTNDQSEPASSKVNVMVVKPIGDTVYVGGRFTTVRNAAGTQAAGQKFLAAFDRATGNWIPTFNPVLDGRVFGIDSTPDGKLIVGGDFTNVNGAPNTAGLAALDPATGKVLTTWKATLTRNDGTGSNRSIVRSITVKDGWIYAGGRFTTVTGGTWGPITVSGLTKVSVTDGSPATGFSAVLPASPVSMATSAAGDRLYLAGAFANISGDSNHGYFGILSSATGKPVPGMGPWIPSTTGAKYQQAVVEVGGQLVIGGSEHDLQLYDHNRTTLLQSHIARQGGDFQAVAVLDGKIYASCHCFNWDYQHANSFSAPVNYEKVQPLNDIGRYDATTLDHEGSWWPGGLWGPTGDGIWSLNADSAHCLWFGGDLAQVGGWGATAEYAGGFGRFCQDDATAPTTPTNVKASVSGTTATLTWAAASDASGAPQYWVYRNDRVVGTTYGTTFVDGGLTGNARYAVRAVDAKGNESATLAPTTVVLDAPLMSTPIAAGSTWRYADTGADLGTAWSAGGFDDSAWAQGPAMLGWGKSPATAIGPTHPVTTYFRQNFSVSDGAHVRTLRIGARVDDGAIIYLNGREVARFQMPAGAVNASTLATSFTSGTLESTFRTFTIPGTLLQDGTNTLAVEVHQASTNNSDAIFDLQLTAYGAGPDGVPPSAPTLQASPTASAVSLSWTPATDDGAVAGYLILRDGVPLAYVPAPTTSWVDAPVAAATTASYVVQAVDNNGNATASSAVTATTP